MVLRGPRLGELGVLDAKSLDEKKAIKLPWCEGGERKEADEREGVGKTGTATKTGRQEDREEQTRGGCRAEVDATRRGGE